MIAPDDLVRLIVAFFCRKRIDGTPIVGLDSRERELTVLGQVRMNLPKLIAEGVGHGFRDKFLNALVDYGHAPRKQKGNSTGNDGSLQAYGADERSNGYVAFEPPLVAVPCGDADHG